MQQQNDYLMLSGIQHFYFCKRQWCLIHIEQAWADNQATKEGDWLHDKADNPYIKEKRKDLIVSRAMPVASHQLKFSGILDVVEFKKSSDGIPIKGYKGVYQPCIVEYKRGKKKKDLRDVVQLVAQVICLEETLNCVISESHLFYAQTKTREKVNITDTLRQTVDDLAKEMHALYQDKITVQATSYKSCRLCSLNDLCMPRLTKKKKSVKHYIETHIGGAINEEIT